MILVLLSVLKCFLLCAILVLLRVEFVVPLLCPHQRYGWSFCLFVLVICCFPLRCALFGQEDLRFCCGVVCSETGGSIFRDWPAATLFPFWREDPVVAVYLL